MLCRRQGRHQLTWDTVDGHDRDTIFALFCAGEGFKDGFLEEQHTANLFVPCGRTSQQYSSTLNTQVRECVAFGTCAYAGERQTCNLKNCSIHFSSQPCSQQSQVYMYIYSRSMWGHAHTSARSTEHAW